MESRAPASKSLALVNLLTNPITITALAPFMGNFPDVWVLLTSLCKPTNEFFNQNLEIFSRIYSCAESNDKRGYFDLGTQFNKEITPIFKYLRIGNLSVKLLTPDSCKVFCSLLESVEDASSLKFEEVVIKNPDVREGIDMINSVHNTFKKLSLPVETLQTKLPLAKGNLVKLEELKDNEIEYYSKLIGYQCAIIDKIKQVHEIDTLGFAPGEKNAGLFSYIKGKVHTLHIAFKNLEEIDGKQDLKLDKDFSESLKCLNILEYPSEDVEDFSPSFDSVPAMLRKFFPNLDKIKYIETKSEGQVTVNCDVWGYGTSFDNEQDGENGIFLKDVKVYYYEGENIRCFQVDKMLLSSQSFCDMYHISNEYFFIDTSNMDSSPDFSFENARIVEEFDKDEIASLMTSAENDFELQDPIYMIENKNISKICLPDNHHLLNDILQIESDDSFAVKTEDTMIHKTLKELTVDLTTSGDGLDVLQLLKKMKIPSLHVPVNKTFSCTLQFVTLTFEDVKASMFGAADGDDSGRKGDNSTNMKILEDVIGMNPTYLILYRSFLLKMMSKEQKNKIVNILCNPLLETIELQEIEEEEDTPIDFEALEGPKQEENKEEELIQNEDELLGNPEQEQIGEDDFDDDSISYIVLKNRNPRKMRAKLIEFMG
ncbi:unnamed protein product [Moneuplotes crassus]|uniref:Uncharacterized protein n=1 Tax=Euplotes crassus TaxID=5936 RepID=A0AAD2D939_EUPCR|nr:unnamed protein product [Moneuplotes crassus]